MSPERLMPKSMFAINTYNAQMTFYGRHNDESVLQETDLLSILFT